MGEDEIVECLPVMRKIVRKRFRTIDPEELDAMTALALVEVAREWNGTGSFCGFASSRIVYRVIDYLRYEGRWFKVNTRRELVPGPISLDTPFPTANGDEVPLSELLDSDEEFEDNVLDRLRAQQLVHETGLLNLLTEQELKVCLLYYWGGRKEREIAEFLGLTESRISQLLTRGAAKLRQEVDRDSSP